jgi:hypothetical protein
LGRSDLVEKGPNQISADQSFRTLIQIFFCEHQYFSNFHFLSSWRVFTQFRTFIVRTEAKRPTEETWNWRHNSSFIAGRPFRWSCFGQRPPLDESTAAVAASGICRNF